MSSEFFQVSRPIYKGSLYFHISFIFLHISFIIPSYFYIFSSYFFIFSSYFFIFLGLKKIPSFLLGSGIWKNFKLLPRPRASEKFLHVSSYFVMFPLYSFIFPEALGHRKILSSSPIYELWDFKKIRTISSIWTWNMDLLPGLGRELLISRSFLPMWRHQGMGGIREFRFW